MAVDVPTSSPLRPVFSWAVDLALAATPLAGAILFGRAVLSPWLLLYALGIGAPLLLRRRWPLPVLAWVLLLAAVHPFGPATAPAVLIALYTVAATNQRLAAVIAAAVGSAAIFALGPIIHAGIDPGAIDRAVLRFAAVGLALALGLYQGTRTKYVLGLWERAARLERERALRLEQAVAAERLRIARELHDVIAHNVSLIVVQAQALAAGDRHDRDGLRQLADSGRQAMTEMHMMLGLLRTGDGEEGTERAPQPGVDDLPTLIERAHGAGLDVDLTIEGSARALPQAVDLSAYRIVQEALTNVVKHAGRARAAINLRYTPAAFELRVEDDGGAAPGVPAATPVSGPGGHGLLGLRERVALFGGLLEARPRSDGRPGYVVHAVLPLGGA